jgi:hypothetical protein
MLFCPTKIDFGFESFSNEMQMCLFRATYFLTLGLLMEIKRKNSIYIFASICIPFLFNWILNQLKFNKNS